MNPMSKLVPFVKKYKWWIGLASIILVGVVIYVFFLRPKPPQEVGYKVEASDLEDVLALSGFVDAEEVVDLHFQSSGRLSWVGVKEGDRVKKYQGIASLDQRQLQKSIEKYLNVYDKQRRTFDQSEDDNFDQSVIGISEEIRSRAKRIFESSQFDLNNSVLDVELQTIVKEYAYLYTPIEGIVTKVSAPKAGMNVTFSDIYQVINPTSLYFSLSVDQTEVVRIAEGMKGSITLDAFPDKTIQGVITGVSFTPKANEAGTVYEVKMSITTTEETPYRIGMTGDVEFVLDKIPNTIAVPFAYVGEENDGKKYVLKEVKGKREKTSVTIGKEYEGQIQILSGLVINDTIFEVE